MTAELIKALEGARQPEWAEKVDQWTPDRVDGSYRRMIDGPRLSVPHRNESSFVVRPQIYQSTRSIESAGLDVQDVDSNGAIEAIIDDLNPAEARALAAALIQGAELLEQWAGESS